MNEEMMKKYNDMFELLQEISDLPITSEIQDAYVKAYGKLHSYPVIMASISGGADSDIMLDMIERVGYPNSTVYYVFFDTGLEFEATKRHLDDLENKYKITIDRYNAKVPVPAGVKKYGYPFLSKNISNFIHRLQRNGFEWEDRPFAELYEKYPKCKAALHWWCNEWGNKSKININNRKWLKEYMIANPPDFPISDGCCKGAKKDTAKMVERLIGPGLSCLGIRKAEGGDCPTTTP
ncbi:MAG: phosphoadenosine phosphosulfate reductase family protein [Clostridiales bacterium]|nr:phosphoadenosine phosphosulfate reductase family protein [Clostridiales bacterium]